MRNTNNKYKKSIICEGDLDFRRILRKFVNKVFKVVFKMDVENYESRWVAYKYMVRDNL